MAISNDVDISDTERIETIEKVLIHQLNSMETHPLMWGSTQTIEMGYVHCLELLALIKNPRIECRAILTAYQSYINEFLPTTNQYMSATYKEDMVEEMMKKLWLFRKRVAPIIGEAGKEE